MTVRLLQGQRTWSCTRDSESHRTYKLKLAVACDPTDGPAAAMSCPGLPVPGARWLVDGDADVWAWCRWDCTATPKVEGEPNTEFELEFTFSSKPPDSKACKDQQTEDPLLEPAKVSGSFTHYTEEATLDRFGLPLLNSAHEQFRGKQVEFDSARGSVKVEQNVASLDLPLVAAMLNTVNEFPLWGMAPRHVKLSSAPWERKYHGSCEVYYQLTLEFEVRADGFDRDLLDEGTKVLHGHWDPATGGWSVDLIGGLFTPDPADPSDFDRFKDRNGENCRVVLNGAGLPAGVGLQDGTGSPGTATTGGPGVRHVEKYNESDFALLGVPAVL